MWASVVVEAEPAAWFLVLAPVALALILGAVNLFLLLRGLEKRRPPFGEEHG